jgi:hypothetical protein
MIVRSGTTMQQWLDAWPEGHVQTALAEHQDPFSAEDVAVRSRGDKAAASARPEN